MKTDPEGAVVLNDTEKDIVIQGLRLMSLYCDSRLGCNSCPFFTSIHEQYGVTLTCEFKNYLPCAWTIPEKWQEEGDK